VQPLDLLGRGVGWDELAVDVALAHTARDELAVLRAEVDDRDRLAPRLHAPRLTEPAARAASYGPPGPTSGSPTRVAAPAVSTRILPARSASSRKSLNFE